MTIGVNQATTIAAAGVPSGTPNARHASGSKNGFGEALGALKQHSNHAGADSHVKTKAGAQRQRDAEAIESDDAAEARPGDVGKLPDERGSEAAERVDGIAAVSPDTEERDGAAADSDSDGGLPTQIRAEHTISAMMAMAPIERRPHGAADGGTSAPADDGQVAEGPDLAARTTTQIAAGKPAGKAEVRIGTEASDQLSQQAAVPDADATLQASATLGTGAVGATTGKPTTEANSAQTVVATAAADESSAQLATVPGSAKVAGKAVAGGNGMPESKSGELAQTDGSAVSAQSSDAAQSSRSVADGSSGDGRSHSDSSPSQGRAPEARRGEPQPAAAKVSVLAQQAVPAPAAPQASANATAVVAAIAGDQGWRPSNASADSLQAFRNAQPMRSLKIELRPAELGTVTANLKTAGEQMSVELQVENREAYDRLSADSEAIVKSLRSLGYEIDRVSIQQPQAATATAQRVDASAFAGSFSRDAASFQSGNSGSGSERSGGQTSGHGDSNNGQHGEPAQQIRSDRGGGSVYI